MPTTEELLEKTSRTFALAIPLLPEPTRNCTALAYLLFRIADTLEDGEAWPTARRIAALDELCEVLRAERPDAARPSWEGWWRGVPTRNASYLELLRAVPQILGEVGALDAGQRRIVLAHALRTAEGMRDILGQADERGHARILGIDDLRHYCYVVAGIVGELLTALFLHDAPSLDRVARDLEGRARAFGEGLQLVNILKDEAVDADEGRRYLPAGVPRERVLALAREDLREARAYIDVLRDGGAPGGFYAFTALSEELAEATLDRLERDGAGAKVPRGEVFAILERVQRTAAELDASRA